MASETKSSTFAVQLRDETSGPASAATGSLEKLQAQIQADNAALRQMQSAMRALKGSTAVDVAAFRQLRDQIAAQKAAVASAQASYVNLGGTFKEVAKAGSFSDFSSEATRAAKATGAAGGKFDKLLGASKKLPGPLGDIASQFEDMTKLVGSGGLIAAGLLAVAAGFVVVTAAAVAGVVALLRYGVAQSDAYRSERLRIQALGGTATAAREAQAAIDAVSSTTAMPRAQVEQLASSLYRAGHRGAELQDRLQHLTIKKLGGADVAARRLLSLDVQAEKFKENLSALFSGLRIEGLLTTLHTVTELFSQSTATGRALKVMFEALFQPLVDGVGGAGPTIKRFFQGIVIAALRVTIVLLGLRNHLRKTFADSKLLANIDSLKIALWAGVVTLVAIAGVAGLAALAFAALGLSVLVAVAGLALLALPILVVVGALVAVGYGIYSLVELITGTDWPALGKAIGAGLVRGLSDARDSVVGAVRALATSAQETLRSVLDIHSPSRVFAELGRQIPRGLAVGINAGAAEASGAVDEMAPTGGPGGGRGGDVAVTIHEIHIHASSAEPRRMAEEFVDELATALEGVSIRIGAPA